MEDNQLDKILRDKLKEKIVASPEMENKIKEKIEEQKRIYKKQNSNKRKNYHILKPLISVAAVAVIAFTFGMKLEKDDITEIFGNQTTVAVIKSIEPTKLQSGILANDSEFIIQADENSSKESIQKSLYIEPAMEYTIEKTENKNEYKLTFNQNIPDNTIVKLEYVKDQITKDSWAYQTSNKLSITGTYPENENCRVEPNSVIEIEFSYANVENLEENVSITPNIEGNWEHFGKIWRFTPYNELEKKEYSIKISNEITAGEEKLEKEYEFSFSVDEYGVYGKCDYNSYSIDGISNYKADEAVKIYYTYYAQEPLDITEIEISKFDSIDDFINYLETENKELAQSIGNYEFEINTNDKYFKLNRSLPNGYYVASIKNSLGDEVFNCPIQINPISAYAMETERDVIVWVADENGLAKNIAVEYAGQEEKTDKNGIVKFEDIADGSKEIKFAKIGNNDNKLVIGLYNYELDNYPYGYIYTDRPMYKNTDTVKVWGYVPLKAFRDDIEDEFYLEINEKLEKIEVDENGSFNYEIKLQNQTSEYMYITLYYKNVYIASRSFDIKNYELQNYTYEIISDKNYAFADTNYEFDVKVKHITGLVVPNKRVLVIVDDQRYLETTSENGIAHFSIKIDEDEGMVNGYTTLKEIRVYNGNYEEYTIAETYKDIDILPRDVYSDVKEKDKIYELEMHKLFKDKKIDISYDAREIYDTYYDTEVGVSLVENISERSISHYSYNEYTKENEPQYMWNDTQNITYITNINSINGKAIFDAKDLSLKENTEDIRYSYELQFEFKDSEGKNIIRSIYVDKSNFTEEYSVYEYFQGASNDEIGNLPKNINQDAYYGYRYFFATENNKFKIGDTEKFVLCERLQKGKNEIQNEGKILRIVFKEDISKTEIIKDNNFDYTFSEDDFPGCKMTSAYYYDGKFYRMPIYYFDFDENERKLDIEIKADKEKYEPGDEVTLKIKTTNKQKPIQTVVNVSVVNEAVFEESDDFTDLVESIYSEKTYPVYTYSSYLDYFDWYDAEGGGGGGPRGKFADTAHFETVYTNKKGEATVKFKLPDNITTYRVTTHAANKDMYVGVNFIKITSTLDFFIQSVSPRSVKTTDDLVLNAISVADEKYDVDYEFTIKELDKTINKSGTTNSIISANFGKLKFGTYHAIIKCKGNENTDAIEYEFNIIESAQEVKNKTKLEIDKVAKISPSKNPICLEIYNKNMSQYIKYIDFIEKTRNSRLDTQVAYNEILKIKNKYYQEENKSNYINADVYKDNIGLKNLPYAQSDLLLTGLINYYSKDLFEKFFYVDGFKYLVKENVNLYEIYLTAAAKNEPVLNDLLYLKEDENIDTYNKLLLTLSFEFLGDYKNAKNLFYSMNFNDEEMSEYKSIIAIIETFIDKNNAVKKINELIEENPADEYLRFAILSFFQNSSEDLDKKEKVQIVCGNNKEEITLNGMQVKTYCVSNEELNDISFKTDSKDLMVSYYYQTLLENIEDENIVQDIQIDILGELEKDNEVMLSIDMPNFWWETDIRIALPNSLRLTLQGNENMYDQYYLKDNNIDYVVVHKNDGCTQIQIPLMVTYEGEYNFENVVVQEDGTYHISNSLDLNIK